MKKANQFLPNEGKGLTLSLNKITKDEVLTHKSSCYSILFLHGTSTELGKFLYLKVFTLWTQTLSWAYHQN